MAELFALGQLVLLLGFDRLGFGKWASESLELSVWKIVLGTPCSTPSQGYVYHPFAPLFAVSLGASSMWDSNGDQTYLGKTNFSIITAKEKQGDALFRKLQCLVR